MVLILNVLLELKIIYIQLKLNNIRSIFNDAINTLNVPIKSDIITIFIMENSVIVDSQYYQGNNKIVLKYIFKNLFYF